VKQKAGIPPLPLLWRACLRAILSLYPHRFRVGYGLRVEEALAADFARTRAAGRWATARLFVRAMWDLSRNAVLEWRDDRSFATRPYRKVFVFDVIRDLRIGWRSLRRTPGFSAVTVGIIALGVGANTTIFTIVNRLFLDDPSGVVEPDRLVRITRATPDTQSGSLAYPDYEHYRDHAPGFAGIAGYDDAAIAFSMRTGDHAVSASGWGVSANYFAVLGVEPALGRFFVPEEDVVGSAQQVAVLRYGFWQRVLGADSSIVGAAVDINGLPFVVVGITDPEYRGLTPAENLPDMWIPITLLPTVQPGSESLFQRIPGNVNVWVSAVGRLARGVEAQTARAGLEIQAEYLRNEYPEWNGDWGIHLAEDYRYRPANRESLMQVTRILILAAGAVLIVAAANLAILMLARGTSRSREVAVRIALGAGRARIASQLVIESLVLAMLGGALGFVLAAWAGSLLGSILPFPGLDIAPDGRVLAFTLAISVLTALLFGILPALQASRTDPQAAIKQGQRTVTGRSRAQNVLVVGQLAVSIILVTGSLLFVRSLHTAQALDLGFETDGRLFAAVRLGNHGYEGDGARRFLADAMERLRGLPGVRSVTLSSQLPFRGMWTGGFRAEDAALPDGQQMVDLGVNAVGPGYLATMGIPLVAGRDLSVADVNGEVGVVINERAAELLWPNQKAIGRALYRGPDDNPTIFRIVGVARTATYYELGESPHSQLYVPILHPRAGSTTPVARVRFIVHTGGDPLALTSTVMKTIRDLDARIAFSDVDLLGATVDRELGQYRVSAVLVGTFAGIALMLAVLGLYGVLSYFVTRRAHEIGIRVALGASARRVAGDVVKRALIMAVLGGAVGVLGALALSRVVASQLFGIAPTDPFTYLTVPIVLLVAAALAAFVPAGRAARVDPMRAMRVE
jgi:predicted permease